MKARQQIRLASVAHKRSTQAEAGKTSRCGGEVIRLYGKDAVKLKQVLNKSVKFRIYGCNKSIMEGNKKLLMALIA